MKHFAPDYYCEFRCIASECRHNCCIGWEIDVDKETLNYYKSVKGDFGKRLSESISEDGCPHFVLGEGERCPFLNSENLCDIICRLGEDSLCDICRDHPRYRNFYSDAVEIGVGLSCEAAARLITGKREITSICTLYGDGEEYEPSCEEAEFFALRRSIFDILQNRKKPLADRLCELSQTFGILRENLVGTKCAGLYTELEYMEDGSEAVIYELSKKDYTDELSSEYDIPFEQIVVYFVYRHLPAYLDGVPLEGILFFCLASVEMIMQMCRYIAEKRGRAELCDIAECARMYSAEIEYSEENTAALINGYGSI